MKRCGAAGSSQLSVTNELLTTDLCGTIDTPCTVGTDGGFLRCHEWLRRDVPSVFEVSFNSVVTVDSSAMRTVAIFRSFGQAGCFCWNAFLFDEPRRCQIGDIERHKRIVRNREDIEHFTARKDRNDRCCSRRSVGQVASTREGSHKIPLCGRHTEISVPLFCARSIGMFGGQSLG